MFTPLEKVAIAITDRVGSFGFFLLILGWTAVWLGWNLLAPQHLRFDPAPAFVFWLFISNMLQIFLMPLLMVGQNLQGRHSELRAENEFQTTLLLERETEEIRRRLKQMEAQHAELMQQIKRLTDQLPSQ